MKLSILEGRNPKNIIIYLPPGSQIANRFLIEQWKPHLRLIEDPKELPIPEKAASALRVFYHTPRQDPITSAYTYFWEVGAKAYRRWHHERRDEQLLRLSPEVESAGWAALRSVGVPADAWFVALHVRSAGYHGHDIGMHSVRNSDIADYFSAIAEVTKRGGWVIRMGDPSMPPLPSMPNVFDYATSAIRSDWMDIFLCACCRFFVGTPSGVGYLAQDYNKPCVLTNWWPIAHRPWQFRDIFVPKVMTSIPHNRPLTLREMLVEPYAYCEHPEWLKTTHGVVIDDNDPVDIRDAVIEMFDRLDGTIHYNDDDLTMRAEAHRIFESGNAYGNGLFARDFLRRHQFLLKRTTHSGQSR